MWTGQKFQIVEVIIKRENAWEGMDAYVGVQKTYAANGNTSNTRHLHVAIARYEVLGMFHIQSNLKV